MRRKFQLTVPETLVAKARDLATRIMREQPDRLRHLAAVAERAEALSVTVPATMVDTLVASGWLHDIGYAPALRQTGFHPLDGATYLREEGWPDPVCALVAHHSGSRFVARIRGLDDPLLEFEFVEDAPSDVLTAADNTARQDGSLVSISERLREKLQRHGPDSPGARANPERDDYIRAAARRVAQRLTSMGRTDAYLNV
jgi:predicted hydrolase (HD superfamily)